ELLRKFAAMPLDNKLRGTVQIPGSGVRAQSGPEREHIIQRSRSQSAHVPKAGHEALEVGNNHAHLRLLQHDLGNPHPIRCGRVLPGQVVAAMPVEPGEQPLGETSGRCCEISHCSPANPLYLRLGRSRSWSLSCTCSCSFCSTSCWRCCTSSCARVLA